MASQSTKKGEKVVLNKGRISFFIFTITMALLSKENWATSQKGSKLALVTSPDLCLDVSGTNSTTVGSNVLLWKCSETTEHWFFDSSDERIKTGYTPHRCLDLVAHEKGSNVHIADCDNATPWQIKGTGNICVRGNASLCLDAVGSPEFARSGTNVGVWPFMRLTEIWSFLDFGSRSDAPSSTAWTMHIYGNDDYPNKTQALNRHLKQERRMLENYWKYMPLYLKKHALNGPPELVVTKNNWDDEVDQGASTLSATDSSLALNDFSTWMTSNYPIRSPREFDIFIQWEPYEGAYGRAVLGKPYPSNDINRKVSVLALKKYENTIAHETGHNLGLEHTTDRCYLPQVGTFYDVMHSGTRDSSYSMWPGPLPCEHQDQVLGVFYQLAFAHYAENYRHYTFSAQISYDSEKKALQLSNYDQKFEAFIDDGKSRRVTLGFDGVYVRENPLDHMYQVGGPTKLGLFTVVANQDGSYSLIPDGPIAHRFFSYKQILNTQGESHYFAYYRRWPQ